MDVLAAEALVDSRYREVIRKAGDHRFWKMTGSGNDFVFVDETRRKASWLRAPGWIVRVCDRRMGVGADGVVFLEPSRGRAFAMAYFNRDGSRAEFCGNAALCSTRLATELGIASRTGFEFDSDSGVIAARIHGDGLPEVDLPAVHYSDRPLELPLEAGELRAGLITVGVPHAVVLCGDADAVDMARRGPFLRHHPATGGGANVDFISRSSDAPGWRMRTFERGVEDETLACGSGAVASAILGTIWDEPSDGGAEVTIQTSSGLPLAVRLQRLGGGQFRPSLRGEGRIVFEGELRPW